MKEKKNLHAAMKMPPRNTAHEIPTGVYGPNSRLNGTDINRQVYQVGQTTHSSHQKYCEGWERTFGEKQDGRLDTGSDKAEAPVSNGD